MAKDIVKMSEWLLVVGGLNWLSVGLFNYNLVEWLATTVNWSFLATIVYALVGISAIVVGYDKLA